MKASISLDGFGKTHTRLYTADNKQLKIKSYTQTNCLQSRRDVISRKKKGTCHRPFRIQKLANYASYVTLHLIKLSKINPGINEKD